MSIWGKLGGAAAGFLAGGPVGALAGAFAGHVLFDRSGFMTERPDEEGVAFTIAIIALGAKLAMADGVVTRDEEEAFTRVFRVPPSESANVKRIFDLARRDTAGYEAYAAQHIHSVNVPGCNTPGKVFVGQRKDPFVVNLGRTFDPDNDGLFTWWAPWRNMRQRNIGWRIDYVLASAALASRATACHVQPDVGTSDHAPVIATFA